MLMRSISVLNNNNFEQQFLVKQIFLCNIYSDVPFFPSRSASDNNNDDACDPSVEISFSEEA